MRSTGELTQQSGSFARYLARWIHDRHYSGSHLEFPSFSQILDAFKRLVLLSVHIKTAHLQPCAVGEAEAKYKSPNSAVRADWLIDGPVKRRLRGGVAGTLPDIASCCIFKPMLREGLSSGLGAPACVVRVPRKLGSFWGFSFPMSQTNTYQNNELRQQNKLLSMFFD